MCCACGKLFYRPLTLTGFCDTLRGGGPVLSGPPVPLWGGGGSRGGFLFPVALFLCYPLEGVGKEKGRLACLYARKGAVSLPGLIVSGGVAELHACGACAATLLAKQAGGRDHFADVGKMVETPVQAGAAAAWWPPARTAMNPTVPPQPPRQRGRGVGGWRACEKYLPAQVGGQTGPRPSRQPRVEQCRKINVLRSLGGAPMSQNGCFAKWAEGDR